MRILYKAVGKAPEVKEVENTLEALQELVEGYIEVVRVGNVYDGALRFIVNEEGRLRGMKRNVFTMDGDLCGPVLLLGVDGEDFRSLTDSEVEFGVDILTSLAIWRNNA